MLGSKVGLAYQNEIYINTIVNNICYEYILYKTDKLPELLLLNSYTTEETNGSTVKIQIKSGDKEKFTLSCETQLFLFNNVVVIDPLHPFKNDYKVYEHELFYIYDPIKYNSSKGQSICISIGCVPYYINVNQKELSDVSQELYRLHNITFMAIKFNIGELDVTLSRENVKFTKKTVDAIKEKVIKLDNFFMNYIKDQFDKNLDPVYRYSKIQHHVGKQLILDLASYFNRYYTLYNNHCFEYSVGLLNAVVSFNNVGTLHPWHITLEKCKYCICQSNIKQDLKYRLKYFGLTGKHQVIVYKDKLTYKEYRHFKYGIAGFGTDDKYGYTVGYLVLAKQQLVRSIKNNFINLESVPEEYIKEEKRKEKDVKLKLQKVESEIESKDQQVILKKFKERWVNLNRKYDKIYGSGNNTSYIKGKDLLNLDYLIVTDNYELSTIFENALVSNNLNILCLYVDRFKVAVPKSILDIVTVSDGKDVAKHVKNNHYEILSDNKSILEFIKKYGNQDYISGHLCRQLYGIHSNSCVNVYKSYLRFTTSKIKYMDVAFHLVDNVHVHDGNETLRNIKDVFISIPKYKKIYEKMIKEQNLIQDDLNFIKRRYNLINDLDKEYPESLYYLLKKENIKFLKPLKTFQLK